MPDPQNSGLCSFLRQHLRPGMVVLDIGANAGTVTSVAADCVGSRGLVVAYEPCPGTASALQERFRGVSHVHVHPVAVADRSGVAELHLDRFNSKRHTLYPSVVSVAGGRITVPVISLDDQRGSLPPVDVIKIDAQGAEGRILAGAWRLLRRDHPLVVLELWPAALAAAGTPPGALLDLLAESGYHCVRLSLKGREKSPEAIAEFLRTKESRWAATNVVGWPRTWPQPAIARLPHAWLFRVRQALAGRAELHHRLAVR
jgi:FkbM family methyltransferase